MNTHFDIWFFLDTIHVLMQAIEQEGQELLAILLTIAAKNTAETTDFGLEAPWSYMLDTGLCN